MYTKNKVDRRTRMVVLGYVQKYEDYKKEIAAEKETAYRRARKLNDAPRPSGVSDPVWSSFQALERIETSRKAQIVDAIDGARRVLAMDIPDDKERKEICRAIWLSCQDGRTYSFGAFAGLVACERTKFYKYKGEFIKDIGNRLEV